MNHKSLSVFITNGRVAWEIPKENGIALMYEQGYYLPPDGWEVKCGLVGEWWELPCGMLIEVGEYAETERHEGSAKVIATTTG